MEKKNIDWGSIGFGYIPTDYRYVANFKDGKWDEGQLTTDPNVTLNECACVFQYAQTVFEGMKAYTTEDGHIVTFRPDLNAERLANSARRLEMPVFPEDRFVEAVVQTIKANEAYVPPYGSGATLYVRPYMFGSNPVIGVKPADEYQFRILTTPVGPYFKGGAKPITIRVTDFDRAAPHGTGHIKAGLNYAMSLHAIMDAHRQGYDENMYLDSATRTKVEETGGANFIFVTKDNTVVTPKSNSILPSITRRSLIYVAEHYLGLKVEEREVYLDEVKDFAECGLCGTAAVISPVGKIVDHGKEICFPFDRAAPHGTGHIKAGLNYAMSLHAIMDAHRQGYDENMYLDSATRTKVEETGGANFIFVTKDNTVVTPKSNSILPSITRRSLIYVAEHYLGLKVEEREVYLDEVKDFAECGLCGTAAVISPVGKIVDHGKEICFPSGMEEMGPTTKKLYETLTGIQMGRIEAPEGWIKVIE